MRVRSSSRRSLATSAAWSDGDATGNAEIDPGDAPGCGREVTPFKLARHCLNIDGWIPSSAAICICGRPLLSSSATASRLNSGVNSRLALAIQHHPRPHRAYQRCPRNRGRITEEIRIFEDGALVAAHPVLEGRHQRRVEPGHRTVGAEARRRSTKGMITLGRSGDMVTPRPLEFYDAVGQRLARENRA